MIKRKIIKSGKKQNKDYENNVKKAVEGNRPLGKPLPNKFLALLIKEHIINRERE